jgi:hypothetical protein
MGRFNDAPAEHDEAWPAKHRSDVLGVDPVFSILRLVARISIKVLRLARERIQPGRCL